jgi:hypothetical protein
VIVLVLVVVLELPSRTAEDEDDDEDDYDIARSVLFQRAPRMFVVRPMIWRELLRESRHRTHFAGRALIAIVLGAIVLTIGLSLGGSTRAKSYRGLSSPPLPYGTPASATVQANMARLGTELFTIWAVGQYLALCALGTIRAASLAEERRQDRLPLLTITGLGARGVVLGTYASILVRALFTMLLLLPILALARGFGGFTVGQVCAAALVAFIAAAHSAALTLAISSLVSGTATAVICALLAQGLGLFTSLLHYSTRRGSLEELHSFQLLQAVNRGKLDPWELAISLGVRAVIIALYLVLAMRLIQRPVTQPGQYLKRALTAMDQYFLNFAGRGKWVLWKSGLGECRGNPIYWRERAISVVGQRDHMIRVLYGSGMLLAGVVAASLVGGWMDLGIAISVLGVIGVPLLLAALLLTVQSALAFVREKERGGMPSLVVTPLTPRQFVMGKYLYALRSAAAPLGVALVFFLLIAGFANWPNATLYFVTAAATAPLVAAVVMYVAAGAQSAAGAITGAALSVVGLLILDWPILLILSQGSRGSPYSTAPTGMDRFFEFIPGTVTTVLRVFGRGSANGPWVFFCAVLLLGSIFSARRSKVMRSGVVIASIVLVPGLLGGIAGGLPSDWVILAMSAALAVYVGIKQKKLLLAPVVIGVPLLIYNVLFNPHESGFVFMPILILLLFAFWQAARYADAGVFNRAVVAVALVHFGSAALAIPMLPLFKLEILPPGISSVLHAFIFSAFGTMVFLSFTVRQFNQLVERNG